MLRFDVYHDGKPADEIDLAGAYVFGQDAIPVRADLAASGPRITCMKRATGVCGLALLWDARDAGRYLLGTTRLPDRRESYILNVELARAQVLRLFQKREDWGLFDYAGAGELNEEFDRVRCTFVKCLNAGDPAEAASIADDTLTAAITLGERMSLFHADIFLNRRKTVVAARTKLGCAVDLLSLEERYQHRLGEVFDFISLPLPWKHTEPREREHQYAQIDAWINWAARARKPLCAGPLVSFDPTHVPEWLYIWENDYEALRDLIYEHIQQVVKRYSGKVSVWNVVSGIHAHNSFGLSFEQLMELTRMSCLLVKKLSPQSKVMIELVQPWGEYYSRNQRTIPPLLYADMAVQSGIKFDTFGVQICMGVPVDGLFVRDVLQISSLLDEFVAFGKTVHVTACQVPSDISPDAWDAWGGKNLADKGGSWHGQWSPRLQAEWLQAFCRLSISKPFVESVCWRDLADYEGHVIPHGGLCRNDMEPKLAYKELRNFKATILANHRNSEARRGNGK